MNTSQWYTPCTASRDVIISVIYTTCHVQNLFAGPAPIYPLLKQPCNYQLIIGNVNVDLAQRQAVILPHFSDKPAFHIYYSAINTRGLDLILKTHTDTHTHLIPKKKKTASKYSKENTEDGGVSILLHFVAPEWSGGPSCWREASLIWGVVWLRLCSGGCVHAAALLARLIPAYYICNSLLSPRKSSHRSPFVT